MTDNQTGSAGVTVENGRSLEHPHIRKVGRYAFYAPCALGLAVLVAVALTAAGLKREYAREAIMPVFIVAFLALRDIEKNAEKRARSLPTPPEAV